MERNEKEKLRERKKIVDQEIRELEKERKAIWDNFLDGKQSNLISEDYTTNERRLNRIIKELDVLITESDALYMKIHKC